MTRNLSLVVLSLLMAGCSVANSWLGGTDNSEPPKPLLPIEQRADVRPLWSASSGTNSKDRGVSLNPVIGQDTMVVAGFNGRVTAFDRRSGSRRWGIDLGLPISGGVGMGEGLVLVADANGQVLALQEASGSEVWRSRVSSEVLSAPAVGSGVVVVRSVDGALHGLSVADGSLLWTFSRTIPALTLRGTGAPLLAQTAVIAGLDSGKVAVVELASGRVFWEQTVAPPQGRSELDRMVDIDATPLLIGRVLYVIAYQSRLTALDVETTETLWTRELSGYVGIDGDERSIYATASDGTVWAFDRVNGVAMWRQEDLQHRGLTRPVTVGNHVVVGDFEGYLHWLSVEDGSIRSRVRLGKDGIVFSPVSDGRVLYALNNVGLVAAYQAQ